MVNTHHAPCQLVTPNMEEQKKASELEDQLLEERLRCDETVIGGWPYGCGPFQPFDKQNVWKKEEVLIAGAIVNGFFRGFVGFELAPETFFCDFCRCAQRLEDMSEQMLEEKAELRTLCKFQDTVKVLLEIWISDEFQLTILMCCRKQHVGLDTARVSLSTFQMWGKTPWSSNTRPWTGDQSLKDRKHWSTITAIATRICWNWSCGFCGFTFLYFHRFKQIISIWFLTKMVEAQLFQSLTWLEV